jgi:ESS family glutamate:Na+ symporter
MDMPWEFIIDFCLMSVFLAFATLLRRYVKFLQDFLVPNSIVAGFFCLVVSQQVLGLVQLPADRLGSYVYHLLALTFIAMGLRSPIKKKKGNALSVGFSLVTGYAVQGIIGFVLTFAFIWTVNPDLFPAFGFLLPLGFGQGPGQAYAIGKSWEPAGFLHGGNLGLTFGALGIIWACLPGVPLVNWGIRRGYSSLNKKEMEISEETRLGIIRDLQKQPIVGRLTTSPEAIEPFALHLAFICLAYYLTYLGLKAASFGLLSLHAGEAIRNIVSIVWGISFVFGLMVAVGIRKLVIEQFRLNFLIDDGVLTCLGGAFVDYMVVASIAAISLIVVAEYIWPIFVVTTVGGILTLLFCLWLGKRVYSDHHFERSVAMYGTLTGVTSTGLVLLRILDPHFETPAAEDLVYGCGIAFPLSIVLILLLVVPVFGYGQPNANLYYLAALIALFVYLGVILAVWKFTGLFKLHKPLGSLWPKG